MYHNDQSKVPNLSNVEMKKGSKFKNEIKSCYSHYRDRIHEFAEKVSELELNDQDLNYGAQAVIAKHIGELALTHIDDIKTKVKPLLNSSDRTDVTMYLGKCALSNGD